ncbi:unnamed protein product [Somion occarium]|uniref:Uncharacterized protein n=1 Tax=Somion occarium TaxID=3059160 RepID=A0ABP1DG98_9APHY
MPPNIPALHIYPFIESTCTCIYTHQQHSHAQTSITSANPHRMYSWHTSLFSLHSGHYLRSAFCSFFFWRIERTFFVAPPFPDVFGCWIHLHRHSFISSKGWAPLFL